jgi:CcmD family protein
MMKRFTLLALLVLMLATPVVAQTAPTQPPPKPAGQDEFVPVTGTPANQETIPAARLVGIAYGFIWVVLFGYVWSVRSRLSRVEREIETVSRRVAAGGRQP